MRGGGKHAGVNPGYGTLAMKKVFEIELHRLHPFQKADFGFVGFQALLTVDDCLKVIAPALKLVNGVDVGNGAVANGDLTLLQREDASGPRPQEPQTPRPASRPLSPPPAGARPGCGCPSTPSPPPPPPPPAPPGLQGPGQSGATYFPGPALATRGRCRARTPLFVNKPAGPRRHLRSWTLSASRPGTPASWRVGRAGREGSPVWGRSAPCPRTVYPSALPPPPPGSPPGLANRGWRGLGVRTLTPGA